MKFLFKTALLSLFITTTSLAREVILLENQGDLSQGQMLMRILQEKFHIPKRLISYKSIHKECTTSSDAIMQLCLKANGEMDIVRLNRFVLENSLRAFSEQEILQ